MKNAELKSQNRITNGVVFILFLIVVFSILIWIRYQKNQQEKEVIQDQKKVMDDAYEELESNKKQIEQKNKEIIDSIYYARYIQRALYPDEDLIKDYFKDYVIFNFPKDIVGGDFIGLNHLVIRLLPLQLIALVMVFQAVLSLFWVIYLLNLQQGQATISKSNFI